MCLIMPLLSLLQRWPIYLFSALIIVIALDTVVGERGALCIYGACAAKRIASTNRIIVCKRKMKPYGSASIRIRNDNAFLEKLAREELNLVRPGEVVYRFPNRETRRRAHKVSSEPARSARPKTARKETR
jgi:hypothetical protein